MNRTRHALPTGTFAVQMVAFCGMTIPYEDGLDLAEARQVVARILRRRRATGHPISRQTKRTVAVEVEGLTFEVGEPEDCMMVPDTAGWLSLEPETVPAVECYECGSLVAIGDCCDCCNPIEDEEAR